MINHWIFFFVWKDFNNNAVALITKIRGIQLICLGVDLQKSVDYKFYCDMKTRVYTVIQAFHALPCLLPANVYPFQAVSEVYHITASSADFSDVPCLTLSRFVTTDAN